jgi:hypothetical protein
MKEGLVAGVVAIFLGMLAIFIGWTIIGGLGLGIPALLLAMRSYRKGHRLLGVFGIIFSCVGIIEGLAIAGIVGFLSILSMPTRIEVTTTPTVKVETVTKTLTGTVKETITKTPEIVAPTTTESIKTGHQIFKWKLLWEKRLNYTAYQIKVSPNGKFVSVLAGRQLLVFSRDGNISYSVEDLREVGFRYGMIDLPTYLLSISDEGESWILGTSRYQVNKLAIVKDGKVVWVMDLLKILRDYVSSIAISRDGKYLALSGDQWIYFSRRENNSLVILWKFKPIETSSQIAISDDNRYICVSGPSWTALLDTQEGKLVWEKNIVTIARQHGLDWSLGWSLPYFITNSNLIAISSKSGPFVLIFDLEGQLIRKIRREDVNVASPDAIVVNNFIIGVAEIRTKVLRVDDWEGKPIYVFKPKGDYIFAIASSLDGKYIAVSDNALRVYLLERED